ncbi:ABC transporter permease [Phaeovulum sp. NW3]|uniref:ABC transporter permease n=1 Tax=Phaeovulum sp. NW3 TaxID=2934933 RepID=UPI00201FF1D0|nr:ABC transporter permease [Phaeovulum sp. NW3]MCL7465849.1 ABC transporter permease [Phaeovulum sp. NW3]
MTATTQKDRPNRQFRTFRTIAALMMREMATTYGRSPGGYLWALVEPIGAVAILTLLFSLAFPAPPMGKSFGLFYATGYLPFMLFNDMSGKVAKAIKFSRPLLNYPAVTYVDALLARFFLTLLTHFVVATLLLGGIGLLFEPNIHPDIPRTILGFLAAGLLGFGVGVFNCYLMTDFPVWERAWWVLTRPLFIISGIFFTYDNLPPIGQDILWYNPLLHAVGLVRDGFYITYNGDYISVLYIMLFAAVFGLIGMLLVRLKYRDFLE